MDEYVVSGEVSVSDLREARDNLHHVLQHDTSGMDGDSVFRLSRAWNILEELITSLEKQPDE